MGAILGNAKRCYIGTSKNGTWTWLTGEQSNSLNRNANQVETSDKSNAWQSFIYGIKGATADVTVFADDSNTQQVNLINALVASTNVFVFIGEVGAEGTTPTHGDIFEALVSSVADTNDNGSVSTRAVSLVATGPVERVGDGK